MSRGDFGYGAASSQPFHDDPAHPDYGDRSNPFNRGNPPSPAGYQGADYGNYNELVDSISCNIFTINNNVSTLDRVIKQIGTSQDSVHLRDRIHKTEQSTNQVITSTVQGLKQLSAVCTRVNRQQKLQYERLTSEFRDTVQRYNTFQKKVAEKVKSAVILSSQNKQQSSTLIDWGQEEGDEDQRLLENEQKRAQLLAQEEVIEVEVAILQEREEHIRQLESDILDINEIFRDLGTLVHEQGAVVDLIESNVEKASDDVESGRDQLDRASHYQKSARKKKCILVVVLVIILGVIGLVIGLSVKH